MKTVVSLQDLLEFEIRPGALLAEYERLTDAAVRAWQQTEVHGPHGRQVESLTGGADRIEVADDVGNGDVRRRQLLERRVQRGGLAGTRRPRHQDKAMWFGDQLVHGVSVFLMHPETLKLELDRALVENSRFITI